MRASYASLITLTALLAVGCKSPQTGSTTWSTTPSGLGIVDLVSGEGPMPKLGQTCVVDSMGWIEENGQKGKAFQDTRKRGYPDRFPVGVGRVIKGWDEGLLTMKVGGKRLLRVPPALGYTPQEAGEGIPPGATLIFELELLAIR